MRTCGKIAGSALVAALLSPVALAAGGSAASLDTAPIDPHDFDSLQRGAGLYVNYCIGCHSLKYIRYTRIAEDLGLSEATTQENLAFGGELFAPVESAMDAQEAAEWFSQAVPPDLSLTARSRGVDWLYTYLKSFYRDGDRPSGWNNTLFENVSMPHALHSLQGTFALDGGGHLVQLRPGDLDAASYDTAVADIVNFMAYVAEPSKQQRLRIGYGVMIFLSFLLVVTYMLYREYWRDIKKGPE